MRIGATIEAFFREFGEQELARERAEYQVVDAARWMLKNDHARRLPGMTEDHLGLLTSFVMYSLAHKDHVPLRVKHNHSTDGVLMYEEKKLFRAGFRTTVVYTYAIDHPGGILFKEIDTDPQLSVTMLFAKSNRDMGGLVHLMQEVLGDSPEQIFNDINTNTIVTASKSTSGSEHRKTLSYIPDPYVPLVPAGRGPLAVWVGAETHTPAAG